MDLAFDSPKLDFIITGWKRSKVGGIIFPPFPFFLKSGRLCSNIYNRGLNFLLVLSEFEFDKLWDKALLMFFKGSNVIFLFRLHVLLVHGSYPSRGDTLVRNCRICVDIRTKEDVPHQMLVTPKASQGRKGWGWGARLNVRLNMQIQEVYEVYSCPGNQYWQEKGKGKKGPGI